jgi:vacuolar-type H+-ATPase subunit H
MEEIVSAEAIKGEILEDAREKAARLLEEAEGESARTASAIDAKAVSTVEEIMRTSEARSARFRMETMARFPLERTRMKAVFVDNALREALGAFIGSLPEDRIAGLSESMLAGGASFLAGREIALARKGISEAAAREVAGRVLSEAMSVTFAEDLSIPAPGLVATARDGSVVLRATMDLVEERLLDGSRGELAKALCAEALEA